MSADPHNIGSPENPHGFHPFEADARAEREPVTGGDLGADSHGEPEVRDRPELPPRPAA